jgi:hypothetical protein
LYEPKNRLNKSAINAAKRFSDFFRTSNPRSIIIFALSKKNSAKEDGERNFASTLTVNESKRLSEEQESLTSKNPDRTGF